MPVITVTKTYKDGSTLTEADLDGIKSSIETALNTTKLDSSNIQAGGVVNSNIATTTITSDRFVTAVQQQLMPSGVVLPFAGVSAPSGYLMCDGSTISRSTYAALFAVVGTAHGSGDGSTTFHLPDYRGRFLRGVDGTAGNDPDKASRTAMNTGGNTGNTVGAIQGDDFKTHTHSYTGTLTNTSVAAGGVVNIRADASSLTSGAASATVTGNETRPKNANVNFIIKT